MSSDRRGQISRRWFRVALDVGVVGGVVAAPIGSAALVIGTLLPGDALLHRCAAVIFGVAAMWFLLALALARPRMQGDERDRAVR